MICLGPGIPGSVPVPVRPRWRSADPQTRPSFSPTPGFFVAVFLPRDAARSRPPIPAAPPRTGRRPIATGSGPVLERLDMRQQRLRQQRLRHHLPDGAQPASSDSENFSNSSGSREVLLQLSPFSPAPSRLRASECPASRFARATPGDARSPRCAPNRDAAAPLTVALLLVWSMKKKNFWHLPKEMLTKMMMVPSKTMWPWRSAERGTRSWSRSVRDPHAAQADDPPNRHEEAAPPPHHQDRTLDHEDDPEPVGVALARPRPQDWHYPTLQPGQRAQRNRAPGVSCAYSQAGNHEKEN
mmetsp:Transcript_6181/g.15336  ORF Transcript_6181/g.15336 Transcript_6181/m.15336 type:complete len:298 (-) Transcript_6181:298-1191(-)